MTDHPDSAPPPCPFCGVIPETRGDEIYHPRGDGCQLANRVYDPEAWAMRTPNPRLVNSEAKIVAWINRRLAALPWPEDRTERAVAKAAVLNELLAAITEGQQP